MWLPALAGTGSPNKNAKMSMDAAVCPCGHGITAPPGARSGAGSRATSAKNCRAAPWAAGQHKRRLGIRAGGLPGVQENVGPTGPVDPVGPKVQP